MMTGINMWAVLLCGVLAMVVGFIWYGPLFSKTWMRVCGATEIDEAQRKEMQKKAGPLYFVQFLLVLFQLVILARIVGPTGSIGIKSALWVWAAFIMPTVAGACMWTNDSRKTAWTKFGLQAGYQLVCMIMFGFILGSWH